MDYNEIAVKKAFYEGVEAGRNQNDLGEVCMDLDIDYIEVKG